jgi:transcriptional regulator with XRE-family HTH domain
LAKWDFDPAPFNVELGRSMRFHRQAKGVTVNDLAKTIGVAAPSLRRMELGQWLVHVRVLIRICVALDLSLDELVPYKAKQLALEGPATGKVATSKNVYQARVEAVVNGGTDKMQGVDVVAARLAAELGKQQATKK